MTALRAKQSCWALIVTAILASCSVDETKSFQPDIRLVGTTNAPIEQQIVSNQKSLASINVGIGDEPIQFITDRPELLDKFRKKIAGRLAKDLSDVYDARIVPADVTYLLLGKRSGNYLVFVIRVKDVNADGSYVPLKGLVYLFSSAEGDPARVGPTDF